MANFLVAPPSCPPQDGFRLGILECDTPLEKARQKYKGYGAIFESLLRASSSSPPPPPSSTASPELQIAIWNVQGDQAAYPDLSSVDGLLITGSRHDAWAETPWIVRLVSFVQQALLATRVRVIGVCFGHQIIGRALRAPVGRNDSWETGVVEFPLTRSGRHVFGQNKLTLHQMHQDVVFQCPPGVKLLGSTDVCPIQGMFVPRKLLTLQGHPEVNAEIMTEVVDSRYNRGVFTEEQWVKAREEVQRPHDGFIVGRAFYRFLLK
ncbi:GMP synthase [Macrophomina phaseolina]|uniref:GMP synthase n=1 Tax=Macrophomina phaseolina TaxID=35725 RepID=A0ABQ8GRI5_9PEZI|nr:GMP synthase [Macrophomina phaseolina]